MADRFIQSHMRQLPLFEQLSPPQIGLISSIVQLLRMEPGQLALQEGAPTQGMFLFVSGRAVLTRFAVDGTRESVGVVTGGQYLDEEALYTTGVEPFSVHIVESAIVLMIPRAPFVQLIAQYPEIRANIRVQTGVAQERQTAAKLFKGQRTDETVLQIWRRHWWALARHSWIAVVVAIALFVVALLIAEQAPILALGAAGLAIVIPGIIVAYLYYDWQDDSVILTDQRIVRIWHRLIGFETSISEIPLDQVLEITTSVPTADVFARMFRYGDITIKTAGRGINMFLDMMPDVNTVQSMVFTQRDRFREKAEEQQRNSVRSDVQQALGMFHTQDTDDGANLQPEREQNIGLPFIRTKFVSANGDLVYRKHSTVWMSHVILPGLAILGALALILLSLILPDFPLSGGAGLGVGMAGLIIGALWFYAADWDWRNDLFIISNETITIIRQRPLWLQNNVERIRVAQIDNVRSEVNGLFNNLLNRGDVRISLIGSDMSEAKRMDSIYDPQEVQAEISRRQSAIRSDRSKGDIEQQRQVIKDYLQTYHEIQQAQQQTQPLPPQQMGTQPIPSQQMPTQAMPTVYPAVARDQPTDIPQPPPRDGSRPPRVPRARPD